MPLPVLTIDQMRLWEEATWASGVREADVIARVGERIAVRVRELVGVGEMVLLLAGRGHNGDDVRASVSHLGDRMVRLINAFNPAQALADLRLQLVRERRPAWIVDGIFGIGLNRDLSADWADLFAAINETQIPVLAVDAPSGLDADTGRARGAVIRAALSLTIGAPKRGLLVESAAELVGRLEVATEVGLLPRPETVLEKRSRDSAGTAPDFHQWWTQAEDFAAFPPRRPVASHKGSYGHAVLLAGSQGYHGAAVLAARGALRARPGLVTVITSPETYLPVAAQLAAPMVRAWHEPMELPAKATALLVGPGLADATVPAWLRTQVANWWRDLPLPMVADASALDWLAEIPACPSVLRVITPHPGEAARMLGRQWANSATGREETLAALAANGACVVLKGHHTLVANADGSVYINPTGNPGLAQGGSGDVLAGFLTGWLAQPALAADALRAIRYAVWEHGASADRLEAQRQNWTAEDLADELRR